MPATEDELETEERGGGGGVEDYPEQPVLSPRAEKDTMLTQSRAEKRSRIT